MKPGPSGSDIEISMGALATVPKEDTSDALVMPIPPGLQGCATRRRQPRSL